MSNPIQFLDFSFKNSPVRIITDPSNEYWFSGNDVCEILGYANPRDAISKHCKVAGVAKRYISYPSGKKEATFINEPNLYRLIIKSRKPEAEPFEAWVMEEVLPAIRKTGKYQLQPQQLALPEPEKKYTFEFTEYELQQLVWAWFALLRGTELCQVLHPALKQIGSHYAASVHDIAYEYRSTLRQAHNVLTRITEQFECEQGNNWRVLKYLRAYNPKATGFQLDIL
ncbi:P22AR C-terminal domain-containing protein [Haemophilus haemolyticus]|uniref:P22AR C-terminal domain-containing protein n=1 Tax=Haemophilus haemolyticus TaxID=726 RepID=UPI000E594094|nr:P22AR C-terminal domain-containing protein [Haemophilus haemolyticus]